MANNSQSRQPAASRPPLGTRRRRSDYDMPNHSVMPSYYAHQDDGGRLSSFAAVGVGGGRPQISLPPDDCSTLFVEGLPADCTRREVSHIFRPFLGFKDVRLVRRESRQPGGEPLTLCFAKFLSPASAAAAMEHLQGYKFDLYENNSAHLRLQFSRNRDGRPGSGHSANH
ncbi:hypothetical protein Pfo_000604 [Paulownia fortunei]|nr:hypothetical protein Pfo_000604 [Paulownia fortunei]